MPYPLGGGAENRVTWRSRRIRLALAAALASPALMLFGITAFDDYWSWVTPPTVDAERTPGLVPPQRRPPALVASPGPPPPSVERRNRIPLDPRRGFMVRPLPLPLVAFSIVSAVSLVLAVAGVRPTLLVDSMAAASVGATLGLALSIPLVPPAFAAVPSWISYLVAIC